MNRLEQLLSWRRLALTMVFAAFVVRLLGLTSQSLWRDEVDVILFASEPWPALLARFTTMGENGPLYYVLMRGWLAIAGQSELALRFPALLLNVAGVAGIAGLARTLGDDRAAAFAAAAAAFAPLLVWYGQDAKMYGALLALSALGYLLAARLARRWRIANAIGWVALAAGSTYVHLFAPLAFGTMALLAPLLHGKRPAFRVWWLPLLLLPLLALIPVLRWALPVLTLPHPSRYAFVPFDRLVADLVAAYTTVASPVVSALVVALAVLALADRERRRNAIVLWSWLLLPVVVYFVLSLRYPLYTERYFIFLAVPLFVLFGIGASWLLRRSPIIAAALVVPVLFVFATSTWGQSTATIKSDFRSAAAFVSTRWQADDALVFLMPQVEPTFRYYFGDKGVTTPPEQLLAVPPSTDEGSTAEAEIKRVWLVLSEPEHYARSEAVVSTLTAQYGVREAQSFVGVGVTLLER